MLIRRILQRLSQVSVHYLARSHIFLIDQSVTYPLESPSAGALWRQSNLDSEFKVMMSGWRTPRAWVSPTSSSLLLQNARKRVNGVKKWPDQCAWTVRYLKLAEHLPARTMSMVSGVENLKKNGTLRVIDLSHLSVCGHFLAPKFLASSSPQ